MLSTVLIAALAGATPKLVAPEWNAVNLKPELAAFYADQLAEALRRRGFEVVTAQEMATLLGLERQKQLLGCETDGAACMAELANALGCDATLSVNLARFDDGGFRGLAKLISGGGRVLATAQLDSPTERKLLDALDAAGDELAERFHARDLRKPAFSKFGWGPLGLGVVSAGVGAGLLVGARDAYDRVLTQESRTAAVAVASEGRGLQTVGWVAVGAGAGLAVAGLVMLAWPASPVTPQVAIVPGGATLGVGGSF